MKNAKCIADEIKFLLEKSDYKKALELIESKAVNEIKKDCLSTSHKELLLLIAKVYYSSCKYKKAKKYLTKFNRLP
jgi:hypothetical protein